MGKYYVHQYDRSNASLNLLMSKICFKEPQWERTTSIRKCTFATFLNADNIAEDEWLYFDYKYLNENLFGCEELKKASVKIISASINHSLSL